MRRGSVSSRRGRRKAIELIVAAVGAVLVGVLAEVSGNLPRLATISETGGPWVVLAYGVGGWSSARRPPVVMTGAAALSLALSVNVAFRTVVHGEDATDQFLRYLAPLWFPFAAAVGAVFAAAGTAVRSRSRSWVACGGGVLVAALVLDAPVSWQRSGQDGLVVAGVDLVLLAFVGAQLVRRNASLPRLAVATAAWLVVGATVGLLAYDRVAGGVDQGPDDVTIHDG